ncbi:transcriptional regulator domain-containing protein [Variovorax sp. LT1R16]|uniref:transcriptional regulator domain-containing protein n=1 Tax=Variovorax sp. LT1R16 TaxID=3443728 RepID=UPI003F450E15
MARCSVASKASLCALPCGRFHLPRRIPVTKLNPEDLPGAPWALTAAYLYVLDLDDSGVAWEYLRRHPDYGSDWARRRRVVSFARWGLRCRRRSRSRRALCASAVAVLPGRIAAGAGRACARRRSPPFRLVAHSRPQAPGA